MATLETPLLQLTAEDIMSRDVLVIPQDTSLRYAAHLLARAEVSGAPVVDQEGRCVGVLSAVDLVHWMDRASRPPRRCKGRENCACCDWQMDGLDDVPDDSVAGYMTIGVIAVGAGAAMREVARVMHNAHVHRVFVLDADLRPVGVVSSMDVLAMVAR